jgi:hypothetical protein
MSDQVKNLVDDGRFYVAEFGTDFYRGRLRGLLDALASLGLITEGEYFDVWFAALEG